jgi:hypothetical protein
MIAFENIGMQIKSQGIKPLKQKAPVITTGALTGSY